MKKGQTWSIEVFAAVMVFLTATVIFYMVILADSKSSSELSKESEVVMNTLSNSELFLDNKLDQYEANDLAGKDCEEMKEFLGTDKNVAIYFKDKDGNLVQLTEDSSYGCEGLEFES